ncbi:hypothetical protein JCM30471_06070 [Desulfuromonas carbonis]
MSIYSVLPRFRRHTRSPLWLFLLLFVTFGAVTPGEGAWYDQYGISSKGALTSPASVPGLTNALGSRDANVRKSAAQYLGKIGPAARDALPTLIGMIGSEPHPRVRGEIIVAVSRIDLTPEAVSAMLVALTDRDANIRKATLIALTRSDYRGSDFVAAVEEMANNDAHSRVRALAAKTLPSLQSGPTTPGIGSSGGGAIAGSLPRTTKENRYGVAVIIGNRYYSNNNKDVPNVEYAYNDAQAMYEYVTQTLGFREGNIIYLKDATQADLVSTFGTKDNPKGKLFDWVRPGQSDIFIYYSGHGAPGLSNGQGYLLPVDGNPLKVELNGYPLDTFYANMAKIQGRSTTIILDACFSGVSSNGAVVRNASSISLKLVDTKPTLSKGTTVLTAAGMSEVASWDPESEHGLFTSYFLKGIQGEADEGDYGNGDGIVTVGEMKKFLQEEVAYNARRLYGRDQNPQISGNAAQVIYGD